MTHGTSGGQDSDNGEDTEEDEELNTESKPLIGPKSNVSIDVDDSPPPQDSTPLLVSSDQHHNYSTIANSTQPGLDSGMQTGQTNRLFRITEEEEEERGLTASMPTSLSPPPEDYRLQKGAARSYRHIPVTDADDEDDDTYQAKLLAMQKEARRKRKIRRTISGALDITEDVGVAILGSENLSKVCDHVPPTPQPSTPRASPRSSIGTRVHVLVCALCVYVHKYSMYTCLYLCTYVQWVYVHIRCITLGRVHRESILCVGC